MDSTLTWENEADSETCVSRDAIRDTHTHHTMEAAMLQNRSRFWLDLFIGLAIFIAALAVYNATLTPSLSYKSPDGNELATIPYVLGLAHSTGYPLYTWLGKLFTFVPIGDVAHRVNLMSAVLGAGGVVLLYAIMRQLTAPGASGRVGPSRAASAFTALLFAFSRAFWSQTGIAEVYAPNVFMLTLTIWLLLQWAQARESNRRGAARWLLAFSLSFGLSLGTHLSNLGFAPAFALFILLVDWRFLIRPLEWLGAAAAFGLGALQFAWLPYKAQTLNDAPMMRHAPTTLQGIYSYTLGAFPQFKFAFPLTAIPDRIVLYLYLLKQQYFVVGILLGLYGLTEMLIRRPKRFFLFVVMYLAHVFFFIQYRVFDLDVFFIPAHLLYAVFVGFGIYQIVSYLWGWAERPEGVWRWLIRPAVSVLLALALLLPVVRQVRANWAVNDCSDDVAINDFYDNVWQVLPEESAILGRSGVFGYDMFYYRLVYNVRPDVLMPHLDTPAPSRASLAGRDLYSTTRLDARQAGRGPWALPPDLVDPQSWQVPLLLGQSAGGLVRGRELVLYHVTDDAPELVVQDAQPQYPVGRRLGGLALVGYDLESESADAGGRLHLRLYWQVISLGSEKRLPLIATGLGDTPLEAHELGLGNLARYAQEFHPPRDSAIVEDYTVVVPSLLAQGDYTLRVGLLEPFRPGGEPVFQGQALELAVIHVE